MGCGWALVWAQVHLFLVGDAGALTERQVRLYQTHWKQYATPRDILIWLGDNIYPAGYTGTRRSQRRWDRLVRISRSFPGKVYVTPGNHDWKAGVMGVLRCDTDLSHAPVPGQPGPSLLLSAPYALIFIDSELYIQTRGTDFSWQRLDSLLTHLADTLLPVIVLHHPPLTAGLHGGYFPLEAHLFPLRTLSQYLYVPLPGLGTLFVWLRKLAHHPTDQSYPAYRALADSLRQRGKRSPRPLIVVSGHDHNLQIHQVGKSLFLVSGSGCKTEPVARSRALWARARKGYWVGSPDRWEAHALSLRGEKLYTYSQVSERERR